MRTSDSGGHNRFFECEDPILDWLTKKPEARQRLLEMTQSKVKGLYDRAWNEVTTKLESLPPVSASWNIVDGTIQVTAKDLNSIQSELIQLAKAMIPWKKGPFNLFGEIVDAEWQSQLKWDRLLPDLPDLEGKRVLDVGSNNGYYLFRILESNPSLVLGVDPYQRPFLQFQLIQHACRQPNLDMRMWGWEEVGLMDPVFDVVFCMGIIYHHRDPVQVLRNMYSAMKPGATLVLESIIVPGNEPVCLFPKERYANMRNVWFVPTQVACEHMLERCKFQEVRCVSNVLHLPEEQRTTPWNPWPSFEAFLDSEDPSKTLEGHAAPRRALFLAKKAVRR